MLKIDTLLYPHWIVPIEPENTVLEGHAIAINEGKIAAILPRAEAEKKFQAEETLYLENHVLLPGLINAHTHSAMTLLRGIADDLPLMDWLNHYIWPAERQWLSESFVYDGTKLAILEMIQCGTTCFNDNYFFPDAIAQATVDSGVRANISPVVIDFSSAYAKTPEEYIAKALETYQKWRGHPLINLYIAPHAPYTVNDDTFLKIKKEAQENGWIIHLHLHETKDEIKHSLENYSMRPLQRLYQLGLVSNKLQCIHMSQVSPEDIVILKEAGAHVVHCPKSNLKLASGISPVNELIKAGINVAIGTDSAASNNALDMFSEIRTAALLAKVLDHDPTALNSMEALKMATINGAKALGLDDKIGSLKVGKEADIIAIDLKAANTQPMYDPISDLVYAVNSRQVSDVWVAGKQLLKQGNFTSLNQEEILQRTKEWQNKLAPSRYTRYMKGTTTAV